MGEVKRMICEPNPSASELVQIVKGLVLAARRERGGDNLTKACSRRSRLSRRLLAQAPRHPSSLLKLVLGGAH